jgi:hypothetical protein
MIVGWDMKKAWGLGIHIILCYSFDISLVEKRYGDVLNKNKKGYKGTCINMEWIYWYIS